MEIHGLVLCGGESKRMGSDKGLLMKEGKAWSRIVACRFEEVGLPYYVSVNSKQLLSYSGIFDGEVLIMDGVDIPGPLRGILSAHKAYPNHNWLILACDLIEMAPEAIQNIVDFASDNPLFDFWIYKNERMFEPFCGVYSGKGLAKIYHQYKMGTLNNFSIQQVFANNVVATCDVGKRLPFFKNHNSR